MDPDTLLVDTFNGIPTPRCPVVPKIWFDTAARLTGTDPRAIIENPALGVRCIIDAASQNGSDAARLFFIPARTTTVADTGELVEVDENGRRLGRIDLSGGWATHLERAEDFSLENPYDIAFLHFRKHPEPRVQSVADARRIAVPDQAFWRNQCEAVLHTAVRYADGHVALIGDCDTPTLAWYIDFRGMEQAMFDLIEQPELVHAVMEKGAEYAVERGRFCLDHGLKILRLNDSVANMSVISPALWHEFILPHMRSVCTELHRYDKEARIYCHVCGNVLPIIDDLLETGLDCIGPLDPLGGFSVGEVREKTGPDMTLLGGVNTLDFVHGAPEQIMEQARNCIRDGQVNHSRYVLSSGCVIPPAVKPENLQALRTAAEAAP